MTTVTKYTHTPAAAGAEVHARAERHTSLHGGAYKDVVVVVLKADPELARAYAMPSSGVTTKPLRPRPPAPAPVQMAQGIPAGETVHSRAQALIAEHAHLDYHEAVGAVLAADPALKAAYARS